MAVGCPVLVSNLASLPEVCGDAALYCNPYSIEDVGFCRKFLLRTGMCPKLYFFMQLKSKIVGQNSGVGRPGVSSVLYGSYGQFRYRPE